MRRYGVTLSGDEGGDKLVRAITVHFFVAHRSDHRDAPTYQLTKGAKSVSETEHGMQNIVSSAKSLGQIQYAN
jgi:hypothetical protein